MSNLSNFLNFLNREHYQTYYTPIAKILNSVEAAILFSELINRHQYHEIHKELIEIPNQGFGWFYHTREAIEERTAIGKRQMDHAINILIKFNLIKLQKHGLPCKRYFCLDMGGIATFLNNFSSLHAVRKLVGSQRSNLIEHSEQTGPYIEEPKEEPKEEDIRASKPAPVFFFGKYVKMPMKDYESLCEKYGKERIEQLIEELEDYIPNQPKGKKYTDHAAALRSWIRRQEKEKPIGKELLADERKERILKNRQVAEILEEKLKHQFTGRVHFTANNEMCILVNANKDLTKKYMYESYEPGLFLVEIVRDLENNFRDVKLILKK